MALPTALCRIEFLGQWEGGQRRDEGIVVGKPHGRNGAPSVPLSGPHGREPYDLLMKPAAGKQGAGQPGGAWWDVSLAVLRDLHGSCVKCRLGKH